MSAQDSGKSWLYSHTYHVGFRFGAIGIRVAPGKRMVRDARRPLVIAETTSPAVLGPIGTRNGRAGFLFLGLFEAIPQPDRAH